MSHGSDTSPVPDDKVLELRANLLVHNPGWRIGVPGDGTCALNGTLNVLGRLLNGVLPDQVCSTPASGYSEQFIHIEQCLAYRDPDDWSPAINDTYWPTRHVYLPLVVQDLLP
jgi:hypothetical protein